MEPYKQDLQSNFNSLTTYSYMTTSPSLPSKSKTLIIEVKNYSKVDIKTSWCCPILIDILTLSKIFCPRLWVLIFQLKRVVSDKDLTLISVLW